MRAKLTLLTMCAMLLVGIIVLVAACGSRHRGSGELGLADSMGALEVPPPGGLAAAPMQTAISGALGELGALACPEGVEAELWEELKEALEAALVRRASAPPSGGFNKVTDLALFDHEDGLYTLTWRYRNLGDYGQEGTVGIEDLTPLAQHFGEEVPEDDTARNSLQAVIDGSGNGKVDIADVTAIAQNYGNECAAYSIRRSDSLPAEVGDTAEVDTRALEAGEWEERRLFIADCALPPYTYIAVAPVDSEGVPGELSNVRCTPNHQPTAALTVDPAEGDAPLTVTLDASESHDPDGPLVKYEWDWEGDGVWDEDTGAAPTAQHTYEAADYYYPVVRVTDGSGATAKAEAELHAGAWRITVVDEEGANINNLAVIEGHPAIAYWQNYNLMYVRATDPLGSSWGEPVTVALQGDNFCNSLAVVNGRPAIAYYRRLDPPMLQYVRAEDAYGSVWGAPVELAEAWVGTGEDWGLDLIVVDGRPAIAYESEHFGVSYTRALDADGANWGTAQELSQIVGNASNNCAMVVAGGRPAICYWDDYWQYLRWLRAEDESGSSWGTPITIRQFPSPTSGRIYLAEISGHPAISCCWAVNDTGGLIYQRASDADGTTWEDPVMVDSWPEHGGWPTLVTVNGRPAISYVELLEGKYTLMYITAADAEGTNWRAPLVVECPPPGNGGPTYSSLAEVSGHPAISYAYMNPEQGVYELRFAIYY